MLKARPRQDYNSTQSHIFQNNVVQLPNKKKNKNRIFIILAVLHQSVYQVAGPISKAWSRGYTPPKERRSGGDTVPI